VENFSPTARSERDAILGMWLEKSLRKKFQLG
jgi:hypothetical protein